MKWRVDPHQRAVRRAFGGRHQLDPLGHGRPRRRVIRNLRLGVHARDALDFIRETFSNGRGNGRGLRASGLLTGISSQVGEAQARPDLLDLLLRRIVPLVKATLQGVVEEEEEEALFLTRLQVSRRNRTNPCVIFSPG